MERASGQQPRRISNRLCLPKPAQDIPQRRVVRDSANVYWWSINRPIRDGLSVVYLAKLQLANPRSPHRFWVNHRTLGKTRLVWGYKRWYPVLVTPWLDLNQDLMPRNSVKLDINKAMRDVSEPLWALVEMHGLSFIRAFFIYSFHKYLSTCQCATLG